MMFDLTTFVNAKDIYIEQASLSRDEDKELYQVLESMGMGILNSRNDAIWHISGVPIMALTVFRSLVGKWIRQRREMSLSGIYKKYFDFIVDNKVYRMDEFGQFEYLFDCC